MDLDPPELLCFCRKPSDDQAYIGCTSCLGWYHVKCLGFDQADLREASKDKTWRCPACARPKTRFEKAKLERKGGDTYVKAAFRAQWDGCVSERNVGWNRANSRVSGVWCPACLARGSANAFWDHHTPEFCAEARSLRASLPRALGEIQDKWLLSEGQLHNLKKRLKAKPHWRWDRANLDRLQLPVAATAATPASAVVAPANLLPPAQLGPDRGEEQNSPTIVLVEPLHNIQCTAPPRAAEGLAEVRQQPVGCPPVYGAHRDPVWLAEQPLCMNKFTGWEPVWLVELAMVGAVVLAGGDSWCSVVAPAVEYLECTVRGLPCGLPASELHMSLMYCGALRQDLWTRVGTGNESELPTDSKLVELCKGAIE